MNDETLSNRREQSATRIQRFFKCRIALIKFKRTQKQKYQEYCNTLRSQDTQTALELIHKAFLVYSKQKQVARDAIRLGDREEAAMNIQRFYRAKQEKFQRMCKRDNHMVQWMREEEDRHAVTVQRMYKSKAVKGKLRHARLMAHEMSLRTYVERCVLVIQSRFRFMKVMRETRREALEVLQREAIVVIQNYVRDLVINEACVAARDKMKELKSAREERRNEKHMVEESKYAERIQVCWLNILRRRSRQQQQLHAESVACDNELNFSACKMQGTFRCHQAKLFAQSLVERKEEVQSETLCDAAKSEIDYASQRIGLIARMMLSRSVTKVKREERTQKDTDDNHKATTSEKLCAVQTMQLMSRQCKAKRRFHKELERHRKLCGLWENTATDGERSCGALFVQTQIRRYLAKKQAEEIVIRREDLRNQENYRAQVSELYFGARMIQKVAKGKSDRWLTNELQAQRNLKRQEGVQSAQIIEERHSVTKLQSVVRRDSAKSMTTTLRQIRDDGRSLQNTNAEQTERKVAVVKMQAQGKGFVDRKHYHVSVKAQETLKFERESLAEMQEQRCSVIQLQRRTKGIQARTLFGEEFATRNSSRAATEAAAQEQEKDLGSVRIQTLFRSMKAKMESEHRRDMLHSNQTFGNDAAANVEQNFAATKIESVFKKKHALERTNFLGQGREQSIHTAESMERKSHAAAVIQTAYRCRIARRALAENKHKRLDHLMEIEIDSFSRFIQWKLRWYVSKDALRLRETRAIRRRVDPTCVGTALVARHLVECVHARRRLEKSTATLIEDRDNRKRALDQNRVLMYGTDVQGNETKYRRWLEEDQSHVWNTTIASKRESFLRGIDTLHYTRGLVREENRLRIGLVGAQFDAWKAILSLHAASAPKSQVRVSPRQNVNKTVLERSLDYLRDSVEFRMASQSHDNPAELSSYMMANTSVEYFAARSVVLMEHLRQLETMEEFVRANIEAGEIQCRRYYF
eukprot:PhF_6_TR26393/c0_g1_i1/m.38109